MRAKCAYYWQKMRLTYLSHFITRQRKTNHPETSNLLSDFRMIHYFDNIRCIQIYSVTASFSIVTSSIYNVLPTAAL